MDSTVKNQTISHYITMEDFLPGLVGILSKDAIQTLTAKKRLRETTGQTMTTEKAVKPMTTAEMRAQLLAMRKQSPKVVQPSTSARKRNWNSSVKVDKFKSHTASGQLMKNNSVRKVLNFQTKSKPITTRATMVVTSETPKFPKPEIKSKKPLQIQEKNNVRISGICNIPETPVVINKPIKTRLTLQQQINKENNSYVANSNKKMPLLKPSKSFVPKKLITAKPETPISNISFKSNSDASFLEKEKEINALEQKTNGLTGESALERIAEVSPPVSTPFQEYRNVMEFFNQTSETDRSNMCNDTIMCFENTSTKAEIQRDESVIVSLCDLLNKAVVTNSDDNKPTTELNDLLEVEKQTENNIKMLENSIKTLFGIRESQMKSLQSVRKLINEKRAKKVSEKENNTTLIQVRSEPVEEVTPERCPTWSRPSVIKSKSPSYKIPKKNIACLRKRVLYKSMPNVSNEMQTPNKSSDKALNMYMEMKGKMNFLSTPSLKQNEELPNTPAVMSNNLHKQLHKLYNGS